MEQINMNGYLTLATNYLDPTPAPPGDMTGDDLVIMAPLWVNNEGGPGDTNNSVVFYQSYTQWSDSHVVGERTTLMMNNATKQIREYTGADFKASNVIVITWHHVTPYPYAEDSEEVNTFATL